VVSDEMKKMTGLAKGVQGPSVPLVVTDCSRRKFRIANERLDGVRW
jgi:hypothetical protein